MHLLVYSGTLAQCSHIGDQKINVASFQGYSSVNIVEPAILGTGQCRLITGGTSFQIF